MSPEVIQLFLGAGTLGLLHTDVGMGWCLVSEGICCSLPGGEKRTFLMLLRILWIQATENKWPIFFSEKGIYLTSQRCSED
jgi:hypothetical protein